MMWKKTTIAACCVLPLLLSCADPGTRTITWAVGKDPTGRHQALVDAFCRRHPGITVKLLEMPESSTAQHDAYVTHLAAADQSIDIYSIDIIWTAEFANAGWLSPLGGHVDTLQLKEFLPGTVAGCRYRDTLWALPWFTDAGLLFSRADILSESGSPVPKTWQQLETAAARLGAKHGMTGYVWQGQQYEGLVCNFLEVLWSCGGDLFDSTGRPSLDSPEAAQAVAIMKRMFDGNASPPGVLTYKEEEARQLFTGGQAVFMRNWPYAWALAQDAAKGSAVTGRVMLSALPAPAGRGPASCLGGWNLAVSRFSKNQADAVALVEHLTSFEAQKDFALNGGRLPTRSAVYADGEVRRAYPHFEQLYAAFRTARPRPVRPDYPALSDEIQLGLHRALAGNVTVAQALRELQERLMRMTSPAARRERGT
ncbi:MAG: ABC transporter substrate-binding protein [Candidatus Edwardsbacteria bacterium]|nr:ABC transporter substrate-binding protein [Candidatus Edwardsbacteria bacterium]